jgi:basic membrane protein A and related proteins
MKKLFALFTVLTLTVALAGCGKQEAACNEDEDFKIGLVTDTGGIDDKSFNQGTWEGVARFSRAYELCKDTGYRYLQSEQDSDYIPNLTTFSEEGIDLIVAPGFLFFDAITSVAADKPNQKFLLIDSVVDAPNVASAVFAEHEGSYLVGVAAAEKAKAAGKDILGFVGGAEGEVIWKFEAGFIAGVHSVDPTMTVLVEYANSFSDDAKGESLAVKLYDAGAYIIYQAAGQTGNGVIKEAKNRVQNGKDVWVIGVDKDQYEDGIYEDNKSVILTSMMKRVDIAAETVARQTYEGYFPGGQMLYFSLTNDGVGIPAENPNLSADIIAKVKEARVDIINGDITVPETNDTIVNRQP